MRRKHNSPRRLSRPSTSTSKVNVKYIRYLSTLNRFTSSRSSNCYLFLSLPSSTLLESEVLGYRLLTIAANNEFGAGMAFGPRQAEAGLLLLSWGGTVLGGISVALGALGVIRPGPAPSIVAMIISLPVLSYGILHL